MRQLPPSHDNGGAPTGDVLSAGLPKAAERASAVLGDAHVADDRCVLKKVGCPGHYGLGDVRGANMGGKARAAGQPPW